MQQVHNCAFTEVDLRQLPLVVFRLTDIDPTIEDMKEFARLRDEIFSEIKQRTIVIVDAKKGIWMNSAARIQMGKDQKIFSDKYHTQIHMSVMVMPNALTKMMLKGVNLVSKPKVPQKIVSSIEEAMSIVNVELKNLNY